MLNPAPKYIDAIKKVWSYLMNTEEKGLAFIKGSTTTIKAYSDSDWGNCIDTARSTSGWVIVMAGSPISWSSKRQKVVAQSTTEAEYIAANDAAKEVT